MPSSSSTRILIGLLLTVFMLCLGCSTEKSPTFEAVLNGEIVLLADERDAISALLEQAGLEPERLEVVVKESATSFDWIRIENGHVTEGRLRGITVVKPFAILGSLKKLQVAGSFSNLNGLGAHPKLRDLEISSAELRDLEGLNHCGALTRLKVEYAQLPELTSLPPLESLEKLALSNVKLRDVAALAGRTSLMELDLSRNVLSDLSGLQNLPRLSQLDLSFNNFENLESLPPLPSLRDLSLGDNPLKSFTGLGANSQLESLDLTRTRISHLEDLGPLQELRRLWLRETSVTQLKPLLDLPNLRWVDVQDAEIEWVPPAFEERKINVVMNEEMRKSLEAKQWRKSLEEAEEAQPGTFVSKLPGGSGGIRGYGGQYSWTTGTFNSPRLEGSSHLDTLRGFTHLALVAVDPANPTNGGKGNIDISATLKVEEGVVRLYLRYESNPCALASTLAGQRSFKKEPDCEPMEGYRYAEASPGSPASVHGRAFVFGSDLVLWLEAVGGTARGVSFTLEPR